VEAMLEKLEVVRQLFYEDSSTRKDILAEEPESYYENSMQFNYRRFFKTIRESARARLMVFVKRTLTKYGYPPDKQKKAIDTVLKQAELLADTLFQ